MSPSDFDESLHVVVDERLCIFPRHLEARYHSMSVKFKARTVIEIVDMEKKRESSRHCPRFKLISA